MYHKWKNTDIPEARSAQVTHSSTSDITCVLNWGHMKGLKTNQLYITSSFPGKFPIADQICEWIQNFLWRGMVIYNRFNCMSNEPFYGDV